MTGHLTDEQIERDARGWRFICVACGRDDPGDTLLVYDGLRIHRDHFVDPSSGYYRHGIEEVLDEVYFLLVEDHGDRCPDCGRTSFGHDLVVDGDYQVFWVCLHPSAFLEAGQIWRNTVGTYVRIGGRTEDTQYVHGCDEHGEGTGATFPMPLDAFPDGDWSLVGEAAATT